MLHLYLAGPDVFRPDARARAAAKKALCRQYGFVGLDPLDQDAPAGLAGPATAAAIYRANRTLMEQADGIVADLSPFRGPSADAGTVFELGFMLGRGKAVFGYSLDPTPFHTRTVARMGVPGDGGWTDPAGLAIENFGLRDNLMIDCALSEQGRELVVPDAGQDATWCLAQCLAAARAHFLG